MPTTSGRPSRYCSAACRQRAYRARTKSTPKPLPPLDPCPGQEVPHLTAQELLAWRGMLEVQTRLVRLLDADLQRQAELTTTEFDVLYQLWTAPDHRLRMNQLSGVVTPSAVTRIVTRLADRGLVARSTVPGRQAVDARLTPEGERQVEQAMDILFRDVRREFIDRIPAPDITRLAALWTRLSPLAAGTTTEQGQKPDML
ncbi:MarR family winged helix-turn-helix transcriptional regulator [Umezawaea endophytica]|uniref:MarR family transcriptional regulator n=1 Tax=Umezawaea endophytica TaxID=1654476 RepID=A0A9X3AFV7_9PSEU|nr:MarR family transcriptional regulator [Umezawaea endophytica]MCS7479237.1 MarR family transcriptional regulator [Umezawaea endophytica]